MTRDELFTVLTSEQGLSEKQANYVLDKGTYHVTPKRNKVVVDFKPEFYTNNDRLSDFSKDNSPKNFKKSFPYYNTFAGWKKLGYKVKAGEKSANKVELMFKVGRNWQLRETSVFSYKQVEELSENAPLQETTKSPVKAEPKAEPKKASKQTSKKSEKVAKASTKKTDKQTSKKSETNNSQKVSKKSEKATKATAKQTSKKSETKVETKAEPKKVRISSKKPQKVVTDKELVKASVKTDWIACNPKEKTVKSKARHNKNTKVEYLCDGVSMTVKNGVAYYDDPKGLITF